MISFNVKNLDNTIKIIHTKIYKERMIETNIPKKEIGKLLFCVVNMLFFSRWLLSQQTYLQQS